MRRNLPPLNSIKVFEVSAKHLSFTKAASELGVTQGAVSKQIKLLEEYLEIELFERSNKDLKLTKKGTKFYQKISPILDDLEKTTLSILKQSNKNDLTVNAMPSFSSWLIPHLPKFHKINGKINVKMLIGDGDVDFDKIKGDLAIRVASQKFPKVVNVELVKENMLLVASSNFLKNISKNSKKFSLKDLSKYPLLEHSCRPSTWQKFAKKQKINLKIAEKKNGFEHFFMLIEAVLSDAGIALIPDFLVKTLIAQGKIINLENISYQSGFIYYLLYSKVGKNNKEITFFADWLKNLIKKEIQNQLPNL